MESESLTKICSLFISWTKALIWKGLSFFAMSVEKVLWTMSNWDCTNMLCIPINLWSLSVQNWNQILHEWPQEKASQTATWRLVMYVRNMQRKSEIFHIPTEAPSDPCKCYMSWLQQMLRSKTKHEEAYEKCPQSKRHWDFKKLEWVKYGWKFEWWPTWHRQCLIWHCLRLLCKIWHCLIETKLQK